MIRNKCLTCNLYFFLKKLSISLGEIIKLKLGQTIVLSVTPRLTR